MDPVRQHLLQRTAADTDVLIGFLQGFIRCRSPSPPGDTRAAAAYVCRFLDAHGLAWQGRAG